MAKHLTEMQLKFLDTLFEDDFQGTVQDAVRAAGYVEGTKATHILQSVRKELLEYAEIKLSSKMHKALKKIEGVMDNPDSKGAKTALDAATTWLDRAGLAKKERIEHEHKIPDGIIVLPAKKD